MQGSQPRKVIRWIGVRCLFGNVASKQCNRGSEYPCSRNSFGVAVQDLLTQRLQRRYNQRRLAFKGPWDAVNVRSPGPCQARLRGRFPQANRNSGSSGWPEHTANSARAQLRWEMRPRARSKAARWSGGSWPGASRCRWREMTQYTYFSGVDVERHSSSRP